MVWPSVTHNRARDALSGARLASTAAPTGVAVRQRLPTNRATPFAPDELGNVGGNWAAE